MLVWWPLAAGIALMAFGYFADQTIGAAFAEAAQRFQSSQVAILDGIARLVAVGLSTGLGWIVFRGPRQRLVGAAMVAIGLYFALVPSLSFTLLTNTGIAMPPFALEAYQYPTRLLLWMSGVVAILGLVELIWPTQPRT